MAKPDADRSLLFGILALQNNFITREDLLAAFNAWEADKSRPLGRFLVEAGALEHGRHELLEALVIEHLRVHGGDTEQSLAGLRSMESIRRDLEEMTDPALLAGLACVSVGAAKTADPETTPLLSAGELSSVGRRFRLLRAHAEGGLGRVFIAHDAELNREVALKQIKEEYADDRASRARFVQEAEITGGLEHPGVVPVYGLGHDHGGRPFYAMRFIKGDSLKDAIRRFHQAGREPGREPGQRLLELRQLLDRFRDVCDAISYAHSRGVLHRDLKPSNIMLGKHGETLVVDWGLAKSVERAQGLADPDERTLRPSSGNGHDRTVPGAAIGTPQFMSPEQALGRLDQLGPACDVYGLGATLYCLLTGKPPVEGKDLGAILQATGRGDFRRPRAVQPDVPRPLEAICLKAMQRRPEDRYPSVRALADDIEKWLAGESVSAWPEPWTVRARRWVARRETRVVSLAAAVIVAVLGLLGVSLVQARANRKLAAGYQREIRVNAQLRAANERERRANARAVDRFVLATDAIKGYSKIASEHPALRRADMDALRRQLLETALRFYKQLQVLLRDSDDSSERADTADALFQFAGISDEIGSKADARAAYRRSLEIFRELTAANPSSAHRLALARCLHNLAFLDWQLNRSVEAFGPCVEAVGLFEGLGEAPNLAIRRQLGEAYNARAFLLVDLSRDDEAERAFQTALAYRRKMVAAEPSNGLVLGDLADTYLNLASFQLEQRSPTTAMATFRLANDAYQRATAITPPDANLRRAFAMSSNNVALIIARSGSIAEAMKAFNVAVGLQTEIVRGNPAVIRYQIDLARTYNNIGAINLQAGAYADGLAATRRALEIVDPVVRANPSDAQARHVQALCHYNRGTIFLQSTPRPADALPPLRRAERILKPLADANPQKVLYRNHLAKVYLNIGVALGNSGDVGQGMARIGQAAEIFRTEERIHPEAIDARWSASECDVTLAWIRNQLAKKLDALAALCRNTAAIVSVIPADSRLPPWRVGRRHDDFKRILVAAGRRTEMRARRHREAVLEVCQRRAVTLQSLVAAFPDVVAYRHQLVNAQIVMTIALRGLGRVAEVRQAYERALEIEREIVLREPVRFQDEYVRILGSIALVDPTDIPAHYWTDLDRVEVMLLRGSLVDPAALVDLACLLCMSQKWARQRVPHSSPDQLARREAFEDRAMAALRRAVDAGFGNAKQLLEESDLAGLRSRQDFRALVTELIFRAPPFRAAK